MLFGTQQLRHAQIDVFPEFAPPRVEIQTPSLGLSATEVEALVTVPLEQSLNGLPGLDVMRSKSVEQLSSIELIFERGTDLLTARQLVSERIASVTPTLPTWSSPPFMIQPLSATSRVLKIGLTPELPRHRPDGPVDGGVLDHPSKVAAGPRGRQRAQSGANASTCSRFRSTPSGSLRSMWHSRT